MAWLTAWLGGCGVLVCGGFHIGSVAQRCRQKMPLAVE